MAQRQLRLPAPFRHRTASSNQANQALDLAQSRYSLGLSSIIELSQAELNQTEARIEQASAKYDYDAQYSLLNYQLGALR